MSKRKIYVIGGDDSYANWMEGKLIRSMENADLVVLTGGADISPNLYGKKWHPTTTPFLQRDSFEKVAFNAARRMNKHIIGICRGAQFLCAMSGGILIQDQSMPAFIHGMKTYDGEEIDITSMHHQAQYPFDLPESDYKVLGWTENHSIYHESEGYGDFLNPPKECEIVYYPKINGLGIQGHPEILAFQSKTIRYLRGLLDRFMEDRI